MSNWTMQNHSKSEIITPVATTKPALLTTPATGHVKGNWEEVASTTNEDWQALDIQFFSESPSTNTNPFIQFDLGIGGVGSEQIIIADHSVPMNNTGSVGSHVIPVRIPKGSRIAIRHQIPDPLVATDFGVIIRGYTSDHPGYAKAFPLTILFFSHGPVISPAGTADTKTSWAELLGSTSDDAAGFIPQFWPRFINNLDGALYRVDLGIGSLGNEVPILEDQLFSLANSGGMPQQLCFYPIPIKSGTRMVGRFQWDVVSQQVGINILGLK